MMKRNESIYVNDQHTDVQNQMQQGQPQGQQQQAPVHLGHSGLNAEQSQVVTAAFAYVEQHSATDPHAKDLMQ